MKIYLIFFVTIFSIPSILFSSEISQGIIIPVSTLGDVSETRKQILENTLTESLSKYYILESQDKLEEVQEKVFQEMNYEECTEDQCIVMIQEALQIENLFILQVIGEGKDTQLTLKWFGLDNKKFKTDICKECGTFELNDRVNLLVKKLIEEVSLINNDIIDEQKEKKLDIKKYAIQDVEKSTLRINNLGLGFDRYLYKKWLIGLIYNQTNENEILSGWHYTDGDYTIHEKLNNGIYFYLKYYLFIECIYCDSFVVLVSYGKEYITLSSSNNTKYIVERNRLFIPIGYQYYWKNGVSLILGIGENRFGSIKAEKEISNNEKDYIIQSLDEELNKTSKWDLFFSLGYSF